MQNLHSVEFESFHKRSLWQLVHRLCLRLSNHYDRVSPFVFHLNPYPIDPRDKNIFNNIASKQMMIMLT